LAYYELHTTDLAMPALTLHPLLKHALQAALLNTFIGVALSVMDGRHLVGNMVFSHCIGFSIWALIEAAQAWLIRDWDTQWRRVVAIVPIAVVLGYALGTLFADLLLGVNSFAYFMAQPRKFAGLLTMSMTAGAVMTYFFLSRRQLERERQRAEVALRQAAEAKLKLLETQLEPHMLFNTLANLRVLISLDPTRAQTMLDHLIAYLRATLSASRASSHTLEQEFARLADYLELMAVRMGPRLRFSLDLPEALRGLALPPLILQPLVENSIQHGLEPKVEGGSITVSARLEGERLCLEVCDTGLGLTPDAKPAEVGKGFGLSQVRERLATVYGSAGTLKLVAAQEGGTRATIQFPYEK
jgi:sensor histidine kinase YesM